MNTEDKNYIAYHVHSSLSLLDSTTSFQEYIERALELGQTALGISEHGNIYNWCSKKLMCDNIVKNLIKKHQDVHKKAIEDGEQDIADEALRAISDLEAKFPNQRIKYLHTVEVYLTLDLNEFKVRDNYHSVIIARNLDGVKEINALVSKSFDEEHFYYKPRVTFEEFLGLSNNVIKTSACLGGPLNAIDEVIERINTKDIPATKDEEKIKGYKDYIDRVVQWKSKLLNAYDFLEVQPHSIARQKQYNKWLWNKSNETGIPLIAGTDAHNLDENKAECRQILMDAKGIKFNDEDGNEEANLDLKYVTYDELVELFERQGVLPKVKYLEAIRNTNKLADMVEDFELDLSFKYPKVSDNDIQTLKDRLNIAHKRMKQDGVITKDNEQQYITQVKEELRVFEKIDMCGFLIFMADLIGWCRENNIPVGAGRGSVAGSTIAYMLGITDVNPQIWGTIFSRFANEDRKEIGDIDVDFAPNDREKVYNHMIEQFGKDYTAYILAITTVSTRGCIDEIGRALHNREKEDPNYNADKAKYTLDYIKNIKLSFEKMLNDMHGVKVEGAKKEQLLEVAEKMKEIEPEIFKYFGGLLGNPVAQSMHPAGMVVSPMTLQDNYGVLYRSGMQIMQIDMNDVHETGLVKYDILGLKNVQIIKDACELAGQKYPLAHEIDWFDEAVWKDMIRTNIGLFQFEKMPSFRSLRQFEPKSLADMSLVTAAIRPSGASYRERLFNKEVNHNPSELIDKLLEKEYGYLVYQEQIIAFLQQICGLTGSEADNLRRAIARKQKDRMEKALPQVIEGYCEKSTQPREVAEEEVKQYIQIIEDASSYMFGYNHSLAYCMIGYLCAYYRYYYTPQFIVSFLNNAMNEEDIRNGFELATLYGYQIEPPRFRYAKSDYSYDGKTTIYKGLASVKWLNDGATQYLLEYADEQFDTFTDLLVRINAEGSGNINSRQMEILIKLNFFEEFGGNKKLMDVYELYNQLKDRKTVAKARTPIDEQWLLQYATKQTEKTIYFEDGLKVIEDTAPRPEKFGKGEKRVWEEANTVEVIYYNLECSDKEPPKENRLITLVRDYERKVENSFYEIKEQIQYDKEFFGYINMKYDVDANYCYVEELDTKWSPKVTLYSLGAAKTVVYKIPKKDFQEKPFKEGQSIVILNWQERPCYTKLEDGSFVPKADGSTEQWITSYSILTEEEWAKVSGGQYGALSTPDKYQRFFIYDLETGGFSGVKDDILEVGYMLCTRDEDGKFVEVKRKQYFVQTDQPVTNSHIHGITKEMCDADGYTQLECLSDLDEYFNDKGTLVIGYNIESFDNKFLWNYAQRFNPSFKVVNDTLDVMKIAKDKIGKPKGFTLGDAVLAFGVNGREAAHRALSDVVDTFLVLNAAVEQGKNIDSYIKRGY